MNTSDLKQDLDTLVRDVTADGGFAAGVASKVRARKRARTAGVGVACVALLGLGAGVTTQLSGGTRTPAPATSGHATPPATPTFTGANDGMPSRAVPASAGDVVKDGLRFRARVGGDTLAVGFIGEVGQGQATLLWDATTSHVTLSGTCYLPGVDRSVVEHTRVRVTLAGAAGSLEAGCEARPPAPGDLPEAAWTPGEVGQGWSGLSVGKPASLRVQLIDGRSGKPTGFESVRLAVAVYNQGPQSVIVDPRTGKAVVALPDVIENNGYNYRIAGVTGKPSGEHLPAVTTPAGEPFLVTWGSTSTDGAVGTPAGTDRGGIVRLAGLLDQSPATVSNGGWVTTPQPARGVGTVGLVREGPAPKTGVDFIAIYTPEP